MLIKLIWQKLDYYYWLSNEILAYCTAIILYPSKKLYWFIKYWIFRPEWLKDVKEIFKELAYSYYGS